MTISRRDTIIIAVLVNVGIMAILLMTAVRFDDTIKKEEILLTTRPIHEIRNPVAETNAVSIIEPMTHMEKSDTIFQGYTIVESSSPIDKTDAMGSYVEISVKRGDSLDKIARANGTTIQNIKRINNLTSDHLNIGQILRVSVNKNDSQIPTALKKIEPIEVIVQEAVYYIVKSGDNPSKIARQYQVNYEDILRLNGLNEESAKNLKPGDRIRVK